MKKIARYLLIVLIPFISAIKGYSQTSPPVTSIGAADYQTGTWSVPVTVSGFTNVGNISMKLNYDASKLIYTGADINTGLVPGNTMVTPASDQSGVFSLSYTSSVPVVLADPVNTLITIMFTVKPGAVPGPTLLTWSTIQGDCEIAPPVPGVFVPEITTTNRATYFVDGSFDISRILNLYLQLEGLYAVGGSMNQAQGSNGNQFPGNVADVISVELHNSLVYPEIIHSTGNIELRNTGFAELKIPSSFSGSYYIAVRHRNSIATVTSSPVSFTTPTINYNFTDLSSRAFGNNLKNAGGVFQVYCGDVNQDDIIDLGDLINVLNMAVLANAGYISEDVNGDALVDLSDLILIHNNASQAIGAITP